MVTDPYIVNKCTEIEQLLKDSTTWAASDAKLGARLASLVTVLLVGLLEDSIEYLISKRVDKLPDKEVKRYVFKEIDKHFRNPDYGAIIGLLKEFSEAYGKEFKDKFPSDSKEAEALDSVVKDKNSMAHNGVCNSSVSLKDVESYYQRILPVIEGLEKILVV